ncbi:hypothetical protein M514_10660 [Trichuris suis]|uniref:Uncharacterized protein n=1 Tax=Trichuris suis TaxID=68888 RepID=A0A085MY07_9BILA|nr:hypothetical protein M514_10660 [Trichuris suis]
MNVVKKLEVFDSAKFDEDCDSNGYQEESTLIKLHGMREADYGPLHHMNQSTRAELTNQDNFVWKWYFSRTFGSTCAPQF